MKTRFLLHLSILLPAIFASFSVVAQSDSTAARATYFLSVHSGGLYSGGLLGKKGDGTSLSSAFIQGVRYKRFAVGAGIGYDAYPEWRIVSLLGSMNWDVAGRDKNALFIGVNAGYSWAWNPVFKLQAFEYDPTGGSFFHPLAGYRIGNGNLRAYMSVGYKLQRHTYEHIIDFWDPGTSDTKVTVKHEIRRLSVGIGIGFR